MKKVRALDQRSMAKGGRQFKLTKNWEHFVIKRSIEKLISYNAYNPTNSVSPFPNFFTSG